MPGITVKSKITRHFFCVPRDQMISSRDLLIHGKRANIDVAVYELIKDGLIRRIARGVFIRTGGRWPTIEQIAIFKAQAFGRDIRKHGKDSAVNFKVGNAPNANPTYYIDAGSSSFWHRGGRIYFKGVSKKRSRLEDTPVGAAIRALWAREKANLTKSQIKSGYMPWNRSREGIDAVLYGRRWMPAWLGDCFSTNAYIGPPPLKWSPAVPPRP